MPTREFQPAMEGASIIRREVTERDQPRPLDPDRQKEMYSGQTQRHPLKHTVINNSIEQILYVGRTFAGRHHDSPLKIREFTPAIPWLKPIKVDVDLGYQGIRKDYPSAIIEIPPNQPRKSKQNSNPNFRVAEKQSNREVSKIRISIEHAIGGMKRDQVLVPRFRKRVAGLADSVIAIGAG